MKWYQIIQKYFGFIFFASMACGFGFPSFFTKLSDITYVLLGVIITISFLTLDYGQVRHTVKQFYIPVGVFITYKVLIPIALYYVLSLWNVKVALAALLLAATPVGMITPALTQLVGGDRAFVLTMVTLTSFAAPFYLPYLIKFVAGTKISLDALAMMFSLVKLIFIPFVISLIIRRWWKGLIQKTSHTYSAVSVLLLVPVLLGVSAKGAPLIQGNWPMAFSYLGIAVVLCGIFAVLGFGFFWFLDRGKRFGLAISVAYMNLAMSIVIASTYFSLEVVIFCIMYEIPANLLPVVLRRLAGRNKQRTTG